MPIRSVGIGQPDRLQRYLAELRTFLEGGDSVIAEALKEPEVAKSVKDLGIDAVGSTPGERATFTKQESGCFGSVIRKVGITIE